MTSIIQCPLCEKAFTQEHKLHRHVAYCKKARARRTTRPRACIPCNLSKIKCNFATPRCAQCEKRGTECKYDLRGSVLSCPQALDEEDGTIRGPPSGNTYDDPITWSSSLPDAVALIHDFTTPDRPAPSGRQDELSILPDDIVGVESFEDFIEGIVRCDPALSNDGTTSSSVPSTPPNAADALIARSRATKALTPLSQDTTSSRYAANLIARTASAFPHMMLRRETFPPFVHPHWNKSEVPEILGSCMSIAHLFEFRTTDTRQFLWRTIETERQHLHDRKLVMNKSELQQAMQAITIYTIMAIIDQDAETPVRGRRFMQTFMDLKIQLQEHLGGGEIILSETEAANPSLTWEDWIFAESRRRLGCFWFAITRVFALKTDKVQCSCMDDFVNLPLLSPKFAWEARTQHDWETAKRFDDISGSCTVFGELLATQNVAANDPVFTRKLNMWESGADKLGTMMLIAVDLQW